MAPKEVTFEQRPKCTPPSRASCATPGDYFQEEGTVRQSMWLDKIRVRDLDPGSRS